MNIFAPDGHCVYQNAISAPSATLQLPTSLQGVCLVQVVWHGSHITKKINF